MEPLLLYGLIALASGAVFAMLGAWIASQKGRSPTEGGILGFLFGPLGALIEVCLPTRADEYGALRRKIEAYEGQFDSPDLPWLEELAGDRQPTDPAEAFLKDLENRHRPKGPSL